MEKDELKQLKLDWKEEREELTGEEREFPKYTTQLMNIANQNAQGTRPKVVGQMSELIDECPEKTYKGWKNWYMERHEDRIEEATERVYKMVEKMRDAMEEIDEDMVREWVEDLVIDKTAEGLVIQEIVLSEVAEQLGKDYRMATSEEESKNIDGFIGEQVVSVKATSYDSKESTRETIDIPVIYYKQTAKYLRVYFDEDEIK